jgi:hypothetical protein
MAAAIGMDFYRLASVTGVFVLGEILFIFGSLAAVVKNYQPSTYPGIIFCFSCLAYMVKFNITSLILICKNVKAIKFITQILD